MTCRHLRQAHLPCADPDCSEGWPRERVYTYQLPGLAQVFASMEPTDDPVRTLAWVRIASATGDGFRWQLEGGA